MLEDGDEPLHDPFDLFGEQPEPSTQDLAPELLSVPSPDFLLHVQTTVVDELVYPLAVQLKHGVIAAHGVGDNTL